MNDSTFCVAQCPPLQTDICCGLRRLSCADPEMRFQGTGFISQPFCVFLLCTWMCIGSVVVHSTRDRKGVSSNPNSGTLAQPGRGGQACGIRAKEARDAAAAARLGPGWHAGRPVRHRSSRHSDPFPRRSAVRSVHNGNRPPNTPASETETRHTRRHRPSDGPMVVHTPPVDGLQPCATKHQPTIKAFPGLPHLPTQYPSEESLGTQAGLAAREPHNTRTPLRAAEDYWIPREGVLFAVRVLR